MKGSYPLEINKTIQNTISMTTDIEKKHAKDDIYPFSVSLVPKKYTKAHGFIIFEPLFKKNVIFRSSKSGRISEDLRSEVWVWQVAWPSLQKCIASASEMARQF